MTDRDLLLSFIALLTTRKTLEEVHSDLYYMLGLLGLPFPEGGLAGLADFLKSQGIKPLG